MNKTVIPWSWLGGGLLLIIILVYYFGKDKGKTKGEKGSIIVAPVPHQDHIDPNLDVPGFAKRLKGVLDGWTFDWSGARLEALMTLYNMNESEFIAVYNEFNVSQGEGETLREWIAGEVIAETNGIKGRLLQKFDSLNLS